MNTKLTVVIGVLVAIIFLAYSAAFVVDETEQVVVTQFGKVMGESIKEPGLYFMLPMIQHANVFNKNLLEWDGEPGRMPTLDKTYIWVDAFARWRITDPVKFFQTVGSMDEAISRIDDYIDPAIRNFVSSYSLIEAVRNTDRELDTFEASITDEVGSKAHYKILLGRDAITKGIMEQAKPKLQKFGIEIVDVKVKRINYVEEVRRSVYRRMTAERKQIAEKYRSEGKGEAMKILGDKERNLKLITSEAYRKAQETKGTADAEVTTILAKAYGIDLEFYSFIKTLEVYKDTLGANSSLVISTDSEFFKYLKGYEAVK